MEDWGAARLRLEVAARGGVFLSNGVAVMAKDICAALDRVSELERENCPICLRAENALLKAKLARLEGE